MTMLWKTDCQQSLELVKQSKKFVADTHKL